MRNKTVGVLVVLAQLACGPGGETPEVPAQSRAEVHEGEVEGQSAEGPGEGSEPQGRTTETARPPPSGWKDAALGLGRRASTASAQFLVDTYAVTPEEADRRIELQPQLFRLRSELRSALGERFSGMWVDHATGGVIHVASKAATAEVIRAIAGELLPGEPLELHEVRYGLAELEASADALGGGAEGWPLRSVTAIRVDELKNRVVVSVDPSSPVDPSVVSRALAPRLKVDLGDVVEFDEDVRAESAACTSRTSCGTPLRGGVSITAPVTLPDRYGNRYQFTSTCSAGFTASYTDGSRWLLTAGHCGPMNTVWRHGQQRLGPIRQNTVPAGVDAARIRIDNTYWKTGGYVFYDLRVVNTVTASTLSRGNVLCKSGVTTGTTCGPVQTTTHIRSVCNPFIYYPRGDTQPCPLVGLRLIEFAPSGVGGAPGINGGDSGGSVYAEAGAGRVNAVGVTSARVGTLRAFATTISDVYASMVVRLDLQR